MKIIDTHLHIWDLETFRLPWLDGESDVLNQTYTLADYKKAGNGYKVEKAVYVEVDTSFDEKEKENEYIIDVCKNPNMFIEAAIISGDLTSPDFKDYIEKYVKNKEIKGVRQVLHIPSAKPKTCLLPMFIENVKYLGKLGLVFEACLRNEELEDLLKLARSCPKTTIVVDHMGLVNPDIIAISNPSKEEAIYQEQWKHYMEQLGKLPNTVCKISGLNPAGSWDIETLRPAVDIAIKTFGEDKIMFASNFPVLHVAMSLEEWILALLQITENQTEEWKEKLFYKNAQRVYQLEKERE